MANYTITTNAAQEAGIAVIRDAYNAAQLAANPAFVALTSGQYLAMLVAPMLKSWQDNAGVIPTSQFVLRFTGAELNAIQASAVPAVVAFVNLVKGARSIDLTDAATVAGLTTLVGAGLLTAPRATAIGTV